MACEIVQAGDDNSTVVSFMEQSCIRSYTVVQSATVIPENGEMHEQLQSRYPRDVVWTADTSIVCIASLLKLYFHELPECVGGNNLYAKFVLAGQERAPAAFIRDLVIEEFDSLSFFFGLFCAHNIDQIHMIGETAACCQLQDLAVHHRPFIRCSQPQFCELYDS